MQTIPTIFDRLAVRRYRARAVANHGSELSVLTSSTEQIVDRLLDVTRSFSTALFMGRETAASIHAVAGKHRIEKIIAAEFTEPSEPSALTTLKNQRGLVFDEEWVPFREEEFDLIMSILSLHWVNDLPGALIQLRRCLRADGLFLATLFGGTTLYELRDSLIEAETRLRGGASPRVSPFVDVRDAGNLLVRAGFALPVADTDVIVKEYDALSGLFDDLKAMGETNAVMERSRGLTAPQLFSEAESIYKERYCSPEGRLKATFEIVTLTGWAPAESQQKPLSPGSARYRLSDALDTDETPL